MCTQDSCGQPQSLALILTWNPRAEPGSLRTPLFPLSPFTRFPFNGQHLPPLVVTATWQHHSAVRGGASPRRDFDLYACLQVGSCCLLSHDHKGWGGCWGPPGSPKCSLTQDLVALLYLPQHPLPAPWGNTWDTRKGPLPTFPPLVLKSPKGWREEAGGGRVIQEGREWSSLTFSSGKIKSISISLVGALGNTNYISIKLLLRN